MWAEVEVSEVVVNKTKNKKERKRKWCKEE